MELDTWGFRHTFLVKIWHEQGESQESSWRARIDNVRDGNVVYLRDASELASFFEKIAEDLHQKTSTG